MKLIKLTSTIDDQTILVNFDNVTHIVPNEDNSSTIYTTRESGNFEVKENIEDILTKFG